jgi:hypothetical protein
MRESHRIPQENTGNPWNWKQYSNRKFSGFFPVDSCQLPVRSGRNIASMFPRFPTGTGPYLLTWVVSDEWHGLLSKIFLEHFGERMCSAFPYLKRLTLIAFTPTMLKLFLNCFKNLPELRERDIRLLSEKFYNQEEPWSLLHQLFISNENRLNSVSFDIDSTSLSLSCKINGTTVSYSNIEKLTIKLNTLHDFHHLLTILPTLHSLDMTINRADFEISDEHRLPPVCELKDFCLRSLRYSWNLDQLSTVLNRILNVENLSIRIFSTNDSRLLIGHEFFSQLALLPLKIFNYALVYYGCSIDKTKIISSWQQFRYELNCVESDNTYRSVLCTFRYSVNSFSSINHSSWKFRFDQ